MARLLKYPPPLTAREKSTVLNGAAPHASTSSPKAHRPPRNSPVMLRVFERIAQERLRQRELLKVGKILFNCDSIVVDDHRELRVLLEEIGEVARAMDVIELKERHHRRMASSANLRDELVQVVAVGTAWLELLEGRL